MSEGQAVFERTCASCHGVDGKGLPGVFPPLAGSEYLAADPERAIAIVLHGLRGPIVVDGRRYDGVMPPMNQLDDADVAAVLNYVRGRWGKGGRVLPSAVASVRAAGGRPQSRVSHDG